MINRIKTLLILSIFLYLPNAMALDPSNGGILPGKGIGDENIDIKTSIIFTKIIPFIVKYTLKLAIILSVIAIILGGYQYIIAYGDEEKHEKATKTITYAIIGFLLSSLSYAIIKIILNLNI